MVFEDSLHFALMVMQALGDPKETRMRCTVGQHQLRRTIRAGPQQTVHSNVRHEGLGSMTCNSAKQVSLEAPSIHIVGSVLCTSMKHVESPAWELRDIRAVVV